MSKMTGQTARILTMLSLLATPLAACDGDDDATVDGALPTIDGGADASGPDAATVDAAPPDAAPPDADLGPPPLRNPVALPDAELASQALGLLKNSTDGGVCGDCHTPGRQLLRRWETIGNGAYQNC